MLYRTDLPKQIKESRHMDVPMPDGCILAARLWLPADAMERPVPIILEYLPYRKNDLTRYRDAPMQSYLAGHGYGVLRLDLRGAGDSEGLMEDEYLPQELQDGFDAIDWISKQIWCNGNVGMVGISWGGFNGLQIAAMQPPALKAIVTLCSTDDRYADDVHYMGGCLLSEQLSWASIMFGRNTLPPDPVNVGEKWRDMWKTRLKGSGLWLKNWLLHQTRDAFWKHGSICEDWSKIQIPVYAVSGWADGYCRSVFRLMENLQGPKKGMVGPWAHRYPHMGVPGPDINFLKEEIRWWDRWLKGVDNDIMEEPMLRLYMQESVEPKGHYNFRAGRWIAEPSWPSPNIERTRFYLGKGQRLSLDESSVEPFVVDHRSAFDVGMMSGKWCGYATPGDSPLNQLRDDAGSLVFETDPLDSSVEMAGDANITLRLSVDRPVAHLAARLVDVHPDGKGTRISYGVFNLTHRNSHEFPEPLIPGEVYEITIPMKHVAQQFAVGHKIRLSISTQYFPMIWTAPEDVTVTLHSEGSFAELPLRKPQDSDRLLHDYGPAESGRAADIVSVEEPDNSCEIVENAATGAMEMRIRDGGGKIYFPDSDLSVYSQGFESYSIDPDDWHSATGKSGWDFHMERGDWRVSTKTRTILRADEKDFIIEAVMSAWEGDKLVHEERWEERIKRNLV